MSKHPKFPMGWEKIDDGFYCTHDGRKEIVKQINDVGDEVWAYYINGIEEFLVHRETIFGKSEA